MKAGEKLSLRQIRAFLEASEEVRFEAKGQAGLDEWVGQTLREQGYNRLSKKGKGLVKRYISKMSGLSRAQVTRLISRYDETGEVRLVVSLIHDKSTIAAALVVSGRGA